MIKALIVDDEARARNVLKELLADFTETITVIGQAEDVPSAVRAIHQHKPDVVFLDIEMPGYTGFQLLDFFDEVNFEIVFTTAYSEYALQAFEISAIDYLLKPIQLSHLERTIKKLSNILPSAERLEVLKQAIAGKKVTKLALPNASTIVFVELSNIVLLEAEGSYTQFYLAGGEKILVSKVLKEYEATLVGSGNFYRVHRSYIVNTQKVKKIIKTDGGYLVMENDVNVPISREQRENVYSLLMS